MSFTRIRKMLIIYSWYRGARIRQAKIAIRLYWYLFSSNEDQLVSCRLPATTGVRIQAIPRRLYQIPNLQLRRHSFIYIYIYCEAESVPHMFIFLRPHFPMQSSCTYRVVLRSHRWSVRVVATIVVVSGVFLFSMRSTPFIRSSIMTSFCRKMK